MKTKHIKINTGIAPDQRRISRYRKVWKGGAQESFLLTSMAPKFD